MTTKTPNMTVVCYNPPHPHTIHSPYVWNRIIIVMIHIIMILKILQDIPRTGAYPPISIRIPSSSPRFIRVLQSQQQQQQQRKQRKQRNQFQYDNVHHQHHHHQQKPTRSVSCNMIIPRGDGRIYENEEDYYHHDDDDNNNNNNDNNNNYRNTTTRRRMTSNKVTSPPPPSPPPPPLQEWNKDEYNYFSKNRKNQRQLQWVVNSIENYGGQEESSHNNDDDTNDRPRNHVSPVLIEAMEHLSTAKTQKQVLQAGRRLEQLMDTILHHESWPIQERIVKATAISGLLHISWKLIQHMVQGVQEDFNSSNSSSSSSPSSLSPSSSPSSSSSSSSSMPPRPTRLPSSLSYNAVFCSLRRAQRREQVERLLVQLASIAHQTGEMIDVYAFNMYLATLTQNVEHPNDVYLGQAWTSLSLNVPQERFAVQPDIVSYNTVLHAAAKTGNQTIVDDLWTTIRHHPNLEPDIWTYNSRLRTSNLPERLRVLDELRALQRDHWNGIKRLVPDRFTIDLVLVPLVRAGRIGDVEELLDNFVATHSDRIVTEAFSAFLITLVKRGELSSARALFQTYVLPSLLTKPSQSALLSTKTSTRPNTSSRTIQPAIRHFNVLIDGYRCLAENEKAEEEDDDVVVGKNDEAAETKQITKEDENESSGITKNHGGRPSQAPIEATSNNLTARQEARRLYQLLQESGYSPDVYTLTSMMGICETSEELWNLLLTSHVELTPAAVRAAITSFGRLGDPSSACITFDKYQEPSMNCRVWNVLLGALADSARRENPTLNKAACLVWSLTERTNEIHNSQPQGRSQNHISCLVDGLRCTQAVHVLLNLMRESRGPIQAPRPNSQTYCIAAAALQYGSTNAQLAIDLFRNATLDGVPADGRFINAIFRCFGDNIDEALTAWKGEIRRACLAHEKRARHDPPSIYRAQMKNLIAAYHGLLYVCGRALRPDIALRIAYAMNREGIEPNDVSLNCYRSGKRMRKKLADATSEQGERSRMLGPRSLPSLIPKLDFFGQYESLLFIECTKYDQNDKRRSGEKRVRIIV